jgi:hypothetical protein
MFEVGSRRRTQPHIVFEALVAPDRDASCPWLLLLDDEQRPSSPALLGHLRERLNQLINANLRYTFGQ